MIPTLKFTRLRFVNFGAFVDECIMQLDRPGLWYIAGRNLVEPQLGANGAGKSTLLNALFWAITGRTMKAKRPGGRIEARKGKGTTEVELDIERRGKPFNILRTRKPNTLTLNGNPITDIDLLKEIGIKPEVLQYTCMFGQSNPMFLSLGKEEQAALFNDLLDLDIWLKVADKAKKAGDIAEASITVAQKSITELTSSIQSFREARKVAREQAEKFDRETKEKIEEFYAQQKAKTKEFNRVSAKLDAFGTPKDTATLEKLVDKLASKLRDATLLGSSLANSCEIHTKGYNDTKKQLKVAHEAVCDACGQELPPVIKKRRITKLTDLLGIYKSDMERYQTEVSKCHMELERLDKEYRSEKRRLLDIRTANGGERAELQKQQTILDTELKSIAQQITYLSRTPNPHDTSDRTLLSRIKTFKAELVEATDVLEKAEALAAMAKLWREGAKEIRLSIIDEALEETAAMATKHAERLGLQGWRIELATERQTTAGTTSLGFTANLYPPDESEPVAWETYSGGEETRLQLAMSYGLSDVLLTRAGLTVNIEWCDESTKGLSSEGITDLIECLAERARETGKSIYMIDHHALNSGSFAGTLTVEKSKTGSHVVS